VLNALRSVPELVWASLLLIAAGLGPLAGTLALALHTTGVLGRLFAESLENAPGDAATALRLRGISSVLVFCYATLPQVLPQLISYSLYRWETTSVRPPCWVSWAPGLGPNAVVPLELVPHARNQHRAGGHGAARGHGRWPQLRQPPGIDNLMTTSGSNCTMAS